MTKLSCLTTRTRWIAVGVTALIATAALAHEGAEDPQVQARMTNMKEIGAATETLGKMAKGETAFDVITARTTAITLGSLASSIPTLFEAPATDPKSEALPAIWENYADFTAKSEALVTATTDGATMRTIEDLQGMMRDVGAACSACHEVYRKP
ncbi:MAG: cytochrome c [Pseudomonadota bacterium]